MELYHLHLLGNYDRLYKPNSEFTIDKDKYNNRMYKRIYDMTTTIDINNYERMVNIINNLCAINGFQQFEKAINLGELLAMAKNGDANKEEISKLIVDAEKIINSYAINTREMAMEEYRKNNCNELPSRLHSLFACSKDGVEFWMPRIISAPTDIYRIEVYDEPFVSNEYLLPHESLTYGEKIKASYKYFHPKEKDLNGVTDEYLVQGKVKILEKVAEVRIK